MPRYIDATNAISVLSLFYNYTDAERYDLALAISAVPTADATEVVRCKDCCYNEGSLSEPWCRIYECRKSNDGFCDEGKRKETEDARPKTSGD